MRGIINTGPTNNRLPHRAAGEEAGPRPYSAEFKSVLSLDAISPPDRGRLRGIRNPGSFPGPHAADSKPVPCVETGVSPSTKPGKRKTFSMS